MNMSRKKSRKIRFKWNCIRINLKSLGPSILLSFFKFFILFRDKITGTITDTLKRNTKRKKSKANHDIPNFLFVNKPYFSSEESLPGTDELRVIFTFWPFLRDKISDWGNDILEFLKWPENILQDGKPITRNWNWPWLISFSRRHSLLHNQHRSDVEWKRIKRLPKQLWKQSKRSWTQWKRIRKGKGAAKVQIRDDAKDSKQVRIVFTLISWSTSKKFWQQIPDILS